MEIEGTERQLRRLVFSHRFCCYYEPLWASKLEYGTSYYIRDFGLIVSRAALK